MNRAEILQRLIQLSHELGREDRHLAILGEGNTSADLGDGTFYVKASGSQLGTIDEDGFTRVKMAPIFNALDVPDKTDDAVRIVLEDCRVDKKAKLPSVETFLHAICLREGGAKWVGHTHPVSVLKILCSQLGAAPFHRHIFPDAIVVCGRHVAEVPYIDPGIRLAVELRKSLRQFIKKHGAAPKVILMVNHGPVVLGQTDRDVFNTMLMLDKWACILAGNYSVGAPRFLDEKLSDRIESRPDEHYRRRIIGRIK
ncbi:MAG TPA: class II aldolase/adducin family protein [Candidatus Saccharimonadales bacterium]|nr:class II aldolase/adducin family protein [Candidatus Saccharimonadales bacterium]